MADAAGRVWSGAGLAAASGVSLAVGALQGDALSVLVLSVVAAIFFGLAVLITLTDPWHNRAQRRSRDRPEGGREARAEDASGPGEQPLASDG